ncbi:alternative ribosome rescue aminoacyl-tRNA hydrolase ArfB [Isoptericola sp. NPDC056605]|uniref:alternative ribosome rescue aminoacyl-tRNA hydrolase ArfB n=1 Tax=unclassified Isoptericola TaxID=2623355 RepID=UPI0036B3BAD9
MPDDPHSGLRVTAALVVPERELSWRFSRSSGPGGQGVNTADSRVELSWDVGESRSLTEAQRARVLEHLAGRAVRGVVTVAASQHRAQLRNREVARTRLAALVAEALAPPGPRRRPTRPTRGSAQRRIDAKKRRAGVKRMRRPPLD